VTISEYRERLRAWLAANAPPGGETESGPEYLATARAFQARLYEAGYAGITWPREAGGQGLGAAEQQSFSDEAAAYDLPTRPFMIGMGMCGPTLVDVGSPEQRRRYLPPLLAGTEIWCQLFSEPGAGSDVASLQTRAVPGGDGWTLTGEKVWTSNAQWADFGAVLARTDPDAPKHQGLTMFVLDMHQPGVTVSPLRDMTGQAPFNEVHLDGARVGPEAVIGELGGGWHAAVTMLGHERVSISGMRQRRSAELAFASLAELARRRGRTADPRVRDRLAELYARERVAELFNTRLRQEVAAGQAPGARGSVGKLAGALLLEYATEVAGEIGGHEAIAWDPDDHAGEALAHGIVSMPASGIAGGTNEIQRGIIGERILGLPKEPSADAGVPFRELAVATREVSHGPDAHR
jgi:alkylation response protein AidB-like acyl-CoA dehydrogenase